MKYSPIMAIIVILSFATHSSAQNIVLVNGQASEVTLDGTVITSVISSNVEGHMLGYQEPISDIFKSSNLKIQSPGIVLNKKPALANHEIAAIEPTEQSSTVYRIVE